VGSAARRVRDLAPAGAPWIAAVLSGVFAIFHGYAHGVELPKRTRSIMAWLAGVEELESGCQHARTEWEPRRITTIRQKAAQRGTARAPGRP